MTVAKHGVSTDSPDRLLIDAGAVYLGFLDADSPGTLLGATKGGNTFELVRTIRRMDADGAKGPVKGMRRLEEVIATIKANVLELTAENLRRAIADAVYSSGTTTITSEATGDGDGSATKFHVGTLIEDCEDAWETNEAASADVDAVNNQKGTNAVKVVVEAGASAGVLAYETINVAGTILDNYDKLHIYIKANIAVAANQLQILLSDEAAGANPEVTINLPALVADTQYHLVVDADFSGATATTMVSVALNQVSDLGACEIIIDEIKASAQRLEENTETIVVNSVTLTRGTDYAMDYDNGEIQFDTAPTDGHAIVCSYNYVSGSAVIGGETTEANKYVIKDTAFIDNVAIVGTISGTTNPVICKITNALCDAGFSLAMAPKDEAVIEVTFTGHYVDTDLDTEPWSIEYPAS